MTGFPVGSYVSQAVADIDSPESLSSWSTTREGGNHEEGAHSQFQGEEEPA